MMDHLRTRLGWILGLTALGALIWLAAAEPPGPPPDWPALLIIFVLAGLLASLPFPAGGLETDSTYIVGLVAGLLFGPVQGIGALVPGIALGRLWRAWRDSRAGAVSPPPADRLRMWIPSASLELLAVLAGLLIYQAAGGVWLGLTGRLPDPLPSLLLGAAFLIVYLGSHLLVGSALGEALPTPSELGILIGGTLVALPYALVTASATSSLHEPALIVLGGGAVVLASFVRGLVLTRRDLRRRQLELSSLGQVSRALPASLDLETLMSAIYAQVRDLVGVNNFYVALYQRQAQVLSYPLAIKGGQPQHWEPRPLSDRLTDRVILTGKPILIPNRAPRALREMGLPELANAPESWLGVPLRDVNQVIGCLSIFHTHAEGNLTRDDQSLLETIAGQAAVAIQNALLYQQSQARAGALAQLSEIAASMTATLDPDRAMELVCQALTQVGGSSQSSIHLADEVHDRWFLARSTGLNPRLVELNQSIPLSDPARRRAIETSKPVVFADLDQSEFPPAWSATMLQEGIAAFIDFPLVTPSGPIGIASIYFPTPRGLPEEQIELLEILVAQAALAVANARAHAATDQALKRQVEQLSRLEAIGREMASTLDPDKLFETILNHALLASDATSGFLAVVEPDERRWNVLARRGTGGEDGTGLLPMIFSIDDRATMDGLRRGESLNLSQAVDHAPSAAWRSPSARSLLAVPILRWGRQMGMIAVESPDPGAFGPDHERFMNQLAAHAAVAMTNASLYQQLEANLLEQSLLYQASVQIANTMDVGSVALAVADSLAVALSADGASMYRWDPDQQQLVTLAMVVDGRPYPTPEPALITTALAPALIRCVVDSIPAHLSDSPTQDPLDRAYLTDIRHAGSLLAIPLLFGSHPNGLIEVFHRSKQSYDDNQLRAAQTIASQAAVALENTDLFRRVRESQERLLSVLNSTQEGMIMLDESGRIVVANRQWENFTHVGLDQWVGNSIIDMNLGLADRLGYRQGEFEALIGSARRGMLASSEPAVIEQTQPVHRVLERMHSPVKDESGRLIGWLVILRDISHERELDQAREQLTEMIVHDLRSPLTTILGSLKLLEIALPPEARTSGPPAQALTVSRRSVDQMLGLVNSLLDIAKLRSGELTLSLTQVPMDRMVDELVSTYVNAANQNGVFLNVIRDDKPVPAIEADEDKLRRVLANLVDNALNFTPPGGTIDVTLQADTDHLELTVADTGPGIPDDMRDRIFEPFVQAPGVARRQRGTGLGLAFARLAVEAHGGRIWAEPRPEGGSIFRLQLPIHPKT